MAIKWKNIRRKISAVAAVFCILLSCAFLIFGVSKSGYLKYMDKKASYYSLEQYAFDHPTIERSYYNLRSTLYTMSNSTGFDRRKIEWGDFYGWEQERERLLGERDGILQERQWNFDQEMNNKELTQAEKKALREEWENTQKEINQNYAERIKADEARWVQSGLNRYAQFMSWLEELSSSGLVFTITGSDSGKAGSIPFDNEKYLYHSEVVLTPGGESIYIGLARSQAEQMYQRYGQSQRMGFAAAAAFAGVGLLGILGVIGLTRPICRKTEGELTLHWWDYAFPDVTLCLFAGAAALCFPLAGNYLFYYNHIGSITELNLLWVGLCALAAWFLLAWAVSSAVKWGKKRRLLRQLLVAQPFRLLALLWKWSRKGCARLLQNRSLTFKLFLLWLLSAVGLAAVTFGAILLFGWCFPYSNTALWIGGALGFAGCCFAAAYTISRFCGDFTVLAQGVERIKNGALKEKIPPVKTAVIHRVADDVNHLADGLDAAVEEEISARRMKAELITNVSHDLKTPLTSIVSYVDLLSKEQLQNETARSYVTVLQEKSERLRLLIENLFEISKAESGNITVHLHTLCLQDLLRQVLAEYDERLQEQGLQLRLTLPEDKIFISGDSMLLWRVFSNLLGNIVKYAMPQTRVYLELYAGDQMATVILKNLSNYEMNFDAKEILQRFTRGDAARGGEGSGLGLSIVDSFLTLAGGRFEVVVDGDLFKAIVQLPLGQAPQTQAGVSEEANMQEDWMRMEEE